MSLFNENMTYPEALRVFFKAIEGKPKNEVNKIKEEFTKVTKAITKKELDGSLVLTSYKIT